MVHKFILISLLFQFYSTYADNQDFLDLNIYKHAIFSGKSTNASFCKVDKDCSTMSQHFYENVFCDNFKCDKSVSTAILLSSVILMILAVSVFVVICITCCSFCLPCIIVSGVIALVIGGGVWLVPTVIY
uniref:Uncharacterized protein n=1 Tax=Ditylenchus dipsaci TaxID=166011 RepID=A0A915EQR7_9BILA